MKESVKYCILIIAGVFVQTVSAVSFDGVMQGLTSDRAAYSNENDSASVVLRSTTETTMQLGQDGSHNLFEPLFVFQLPNVGMEDSPFISVALSAELLYNCGAWFGFAADLYGSEPRNTADVLASDYYMGANDTSPTFTKLKDTWINFNVDPGVPAGTKTFAQEEILNYINDVYEGGTNAGKYIVIRISMNGPGYGWCQASFASANSETESFRPKISYTAARNLVSGKVIADHNDVN
ncbi:MAG: hypothetical protein PF692_06220, partial [Kiritimatiellae bacterium]|nr:hypothetical protein [Kiritimatiellia bacterium]